MMAFIAADVFREHSKPSDFPARIYCEYTRSRNLRKTARTSVWLPNPLALVPPHTIICCTLDRIYNYLAFADFKTLTVFLFYGCNQNMKIFTKIAGYCIHAYYLPVCFVYYIGVFVYLKIIMKCYSDQEVTAL